MKRHAALCLLLLSGCATVSASRSHQTTCMSGNPESQGDEGGQPGPVRLETPAGTFLVHPNNAEDFGKLLAGEPTEHQYFSVTDLP
ncbi:hypothetical protein D187_003386 [Cystobacter fuscus DSM 2262]|uniref:Lipoprotein n=1 Tax=Cystobacter fuscus (strain ATCC 25194 / DSM 2262 / NBRC 100088 / M29) TaxID=1242864 RepID=S9QCD5_CYSF2|nr:hypothetical protein [Cystobacter fuscus]EPX59009.1 hypothetical protein D187_003386 [Cystobacter fuscus DSM 2262]